MAEKSFDKAFKELQQIVNELKKEDISIDILSKRLKQATELVDFCKKRLRTVEEEIENISTENEE